jgi:hypothetical protein
MCDKNVRKIQKIKNNIDFHRASNLEIRVGGTEHTAATSTISVSRVIMVGLVKLFFKRIFKRTQHWW